MKFSPSPVIRKTWASFIFTRKLTVRHYEHATKWRPRREQCEHFLNSVSVVIIEIGATRQLTTPTDCPLTLTLGQTRQKKCARHILRHYWVYISTISFVVCTFRVPSRRHGDLHPSFNRPTFKCTFVEMQFT